MLMVSIVPTIVLAIILVLTISFISYKIKFIALKSAPFYGNLVICLTMFLIFVLLVLLVEYDQIVTEAQFLVEITSPNYHKFEQQWNIINSLMDKRRWLTGEQYKILKCWVDYMLSSDCFDQLTQQQKYKLNLIKLRLDAL